ncbi:MAG: 50S ribosomal protein L3 N(5)-glutamine methyltransferase [Chromatiales bacterium]|nr:50S ribosomal protein L3 N(5)-glutamine methyltransferase [Chromatiales bacterium]
MITPRDAEEAIAEMRSAIDLIRWGASQMQRCDVALGHGTDDPVGEALAIVSHALWLDVGAPDSILNGRLTRAERCRVVDLLVKRINGRIPAAYLTGTAWFAGLAFQCDERALVPRSPLAEHIERRFEPWVDAHQIERIADLGTGGGCIAIALATVFEDAEVDAVDVCQKALSLAAENVAMHGVQDRVHLHEADLYDGLNGKYQLIVTNPPYVPLSDVDEAPAEFHQEPRDALCGGADGLDVVRRIMMGAADHLSDDGLLILEVGATWPALEEAYPHLPFTWLPCERGGEGIGLLERDALVAA